MDVLVEVDVRPGEAREISGGVAERVKASFESTLSPMIHSSL